jgi:hypothetical protein
MQAPAFQHLCEKETILIGEGKLIVGKRGPEPMATTSFLELTCYSIKELRVLDAREKINYAVREEITMAYEDIAIPSWSGWKLRKPIFSGMPYEWKQAYEPGNLNEFMERRAAGHAVADGKINQKGMRDFRQQIAVAVARLDFCSDPAGLRKDFELGIGKAPSLGLARADGCVLAIDRLAVKVDPKTDDIRSLRWNGVTNDLADTRLTGFNSYSYLLGTDPRLAVSAGPSSSHLFVRPDEAVVTVHKPAAGRKFGACRPHPES